MRISDWSSDVCSSDLLAIAAKCAAISPCAFLFVIRKFGGAVNRWILSCQQDFSGLGPQTMVSGKAETASEAGGWTFSRFIVEDRRIGGSGGARSSAPLLRTLVLQRPKALFDQLGRASCRERGCQSVQISGVPG